MVVVRSLCARLDLEGYELTRQIFWEQSSFVGGVGPLK